MAGRRKGRPPRPPKHPKRTGRHNEGPKGVRERFYANPVHHCRSHGQIYAYILVAFLFLQHQHVIQLCVLACMLSFDYLQIPSESGKLPYILRPLVPWSRSYKSVLALVASDLGYGATAVLSCMYLPFHAGTLSDLFQVALECLIIKTIVNSQMMNDFLKHSLRLRVVSSTAALRPLRKFRSFHQNTHSFAKGVASAYNEAYGEAVDDKTYLRGPNGSPLVMYPLGLGESSEVYAVTLHSGRLVACKAVYVDDGDPVDEDRRHMYAEALQNDAWIMKRLQHPHLPSFVDMVEDKLYFLPVARSDLQQYFENNCLGGQYRWDFRKRMMPWLGCLSSTLRYLHRQGIRHNDLKSPNVIVDGDKVWITDLGTAIDTIAAGTNVSRGQAMARTEIYAAPEVLKGIEWSFPADIFGLGCICLEILTVMCDKPLKHLQKAKTKRGGDVRYAEKLDWIIRHWLPSLSPPSKLGFETSQMEDFMAVKDLVARMLHPDPHHRPTAEELAFGPSFQRKCCNCPRRRRLRDAPAAFHGPVQDVYFPREKSEKPLFGEVAFPRDIRYKIAAQTGLEPGATSMHRQVSSSSTLHSELSLSVSVFSPDPTSGTLTPRTSINPSSLDLGQPLAGEFASMDLPTLQLSPEDIFPSRIPSDSTQLRQLVNDTQPFPQSWNPLEPHVTSAEKRERYLTQVLDELGPVPSISRVLTESSDGSSTVRDMSPNRSRDSGQGLASLCTTSAEILV